MLTNIKQQMFIEYIMKFLLLLHPQDHKAVGAGKPSGGLFYVVTLQPVGMLLEDLWESEPKIRPRLAPDTGKQLFTCEDIL